MTERVGIAKAVFTIGQGNTQPTIRATLRDGSGVPLDLAAVNFRMKSMNTGLTLLNAAATVIAPGAANGRVEYEWQAGDTSEWGWMEIQWQCVLVTGGGITVPNFGGDPLYISEAIV